MSCLNREAEWMCRVGVLALVLAVCAGCGGGGSEVASCTQTKKEADTDEY